MRVTVEVDNQFLHLLNANIQLTRNVRGWLLGNDEAGDITASQVLGLLVYMEARGAFPEEIHSKTPIMWRPNIEVIHDERRVYQTKRGRAHVLISGPRLYPGEARWCEKHQVIYETATCPMCGAGMPA